MSLDYYLFWPDNQALTSQGFTEAVGVPCVFDSNWEYQAIPSKYLRARAVADVTTTGAPIRFRVRRIPTAKSLRTFGDALVNFLEWCSTKDLAWTNIRYVSHILFGYQKDMIEGRWSSRRNQLKPRTVNIRVGEACKFLQWAADNNLRERFDIPKDIGRLPKDRDRQIRMQSDGQIGMRIGAVRVDPIHLRIPTDKEIHRWINAVRVRSGNTKALMCELILATGIRREETVQWRVDTLPISKNDWHVIGDDVMVDICFGAKGPKHLTPDGYEHGPVRQVLVPLTVANRIDHYREYFRPRLRAKYVRSASTLHIKRIRMTQTTPYLFLSDSTGEPISAQRLYLAWTEAPEIPYKGWSPHGGRHWWACKKLLEVSSRQFQTFPLEVTYGDPHSALISTAEDAINLLIRPQLGHVSAKTTEAYLVWLRQALTLNTVHDAYEMALEELIEASEVVNG